MASQRNFPLTLSVLLLSVCLALPTAFGTCRSLPLLPFYFLLLSARLLFPLQGQCNWYQGACGPIASYSVRFTREQYPIRDQAFLFAFNATGAQAASNCGIIFFANDMAEVPQDLCQDNYGRIVKHLPASALQVVLMTLQSTAYDNYLKWDSYTNVAYYDSIATQGAGTVLAV